MNRTVSAFCHWEKFYFLIKEHCFLIQFELEFLKLMCDDLAQKKVVSEN